MTEGLLEITTTGPTIPPDTVTTAAPMPCWMRNWPAAWLGELTFAACLDRSTGPDFLVLADREFLGLPLWRTFTATGAHLLWRVSANQVLSGQELLPRLLAQSPASRHRR